MKKLLSVMLVAVILCTAFSAVYASDNSSRPLGMLSVEGDYSIDGGNVSATIVNSYEDDCNVTMIAAVYNEVNGVKVLTDIKIDSKPIPGNDSEDFLATVTIGGGDTLKVFAFANDNLEIVQKSEILAVYEYLGVGDDGEDVYKINRFN